MIIAINTCITLLTMSCKSACFYVAYCAVFVIIDRICLIVITITISVSVSVSDS